MKHIEQIFTNAKLVLPDEVVDGTIVIRGGVIADVQPGHAQNGQDMEGDFLIPGLVELHTDHLENHYHPRPGVDWPAISAVMAHDAQIAGAGITTVYDALRAGTFDPGDLAARDGEKLIIAINEAQAAGHLRAEHFIHLRCEMPCPDTIDSAERTTAAGRVGLISIMDHTPGARQFTSLDKFRQYYLGKKLILPEKIEAYIEERIGYQKQFAAANKAAILALADELGIAKLSHDDATVAHVDEALADGVNIAEFPTTAESAKAAHGHGLKVLMGAPNFVRGGSHSGNISTLDVARAGHLDIMSSDYVPVSLLMAAFALPEATEAMSLAQALRLVTLNPAEAAGLIDRGQIAAGKRADLVRVRRVEGQPVVRQVWRAGHRVL
ncbi:MAG: alpha-D-ribose 1-methylphosphonate 5-triphosphate diphosphatase [Alphaproteobacteria bacterium]|nr:alpha-D-ribose 1-methylphosphonate 5-triphosphate diphosphatase [Alphaproteobacteria bacterium]